MASMTSHAEAYPVVDSNLFTFKPKLNDKSNEIAQNLLSNFYERQSKHTQRLAELKELAAANYRDWYTRDKRPKQQLDTQKSNSDTQSAVDEPSSPRQKDISIVRAKENQFNSRLAKLIQAYGSSLPRRTKLPAVRAPVRTVKHGSRGSAPPAIQVKQSESTKVEIQELAPSPVASPPSLPPAPVLAPIVIRPTRRAPMILKPKSPPKVVRRVESPPKRSTVINEPVNSERLKLAREEAERAMREHKIFTINGTYPALRESLRRRGWVEKFDRTLLFPSVHEKKRSSKRNAKSDDDDDDDDAIVGDIDYEELPADSEENQTPPWEENDGYYGILSRMVKTAAPDLVWTVLATYDTSLLNRDQMVNHFERNGCLTTKVGLCTVLKNLPWFHSGSADEFYPRCYKLTHDDERTAFIDDYRLTACISFLKLIRNRCKGILEPNINSSLDMSLSQPSLQTVPSSFIEFALNKVEQFTAARNHEDIDIKLASQKASTDEQWTQFIEQFYAASHFYAEIDGMKTYSSRVEQCLKNVEHHWPQYRIDGTRNIWISKPGAKSRGRGIVVYDRLDDMLKLCTSTVTDKAKFIVQKYIERPLLIHNVKFDIRQWFLVTDWNPLTIWMYKDCYFRFCTEYFSLATRQQNVHLCNHAIQKHYKNNATRHSDLPRENMWRSAEFIDKYLRPKKLAAKWDSFIYPSMKEAIICAMLVAQDTIDARKNSFELFGADFMLGEDLQPWLIEINCSPTMARCTAVTTEMCDAVLEDTCKVVIDRKYERSEDTGRFELIHKGTLVAVPNYVGIDLRVEGKTYKTNRTYVSRSNNIKTDAPASAPAATTSSKKSLSDSINLSTDHQDTFLEMTQSSVDFTTNKKTLDDPASSTKGARDEHVSKINLGECIFEEDELKSPGTLPFFRRIQNTFLSHKRKEPNVGETNHNSKVFDSASNISAPSVLETDNEHITGIPVS
ncbi:unnamed protein product [Adineta ricciae]|uniref:Uncharacterized protein n=1 Tax=Adineta ricciae TaxID=249248 RepID=A0A814HI87_ADIRI|nr:unnamed protein product [Adineta ricciae]